MKAIFGFVKAFGKEKVDDGVESVAIFLTKIDPKAATDAQLTILKEKRDDYAKKLVSARRALAKDLGETEAIQSQIDKGKQALGILQGSLADASKSKKKTIMSQATGIAKKIEDLGPKLSHEQKQDVQAQQVVDAVQKLYDQMESILKDAGSKLEEAQRRMQSSQADAEHAKMMEELNEGHKAFSGLNVALDAMSEAADSAEEEAEVIRMTTPDSTSGVDQSIDDILAQASESADPDANDPFRHLS